MLKSLTKSILYCTVPSQSTGLHFPTLLRQKNISDCISHARLLPFPRVLFSFSVFHLRLDSKINPVFTAVLFTPSEISAQRRTAVVVNIMLFTMVHYGKHGTVFLEHHSSRSQWLCSVRMREMYSNTGPPPHTHTSCPFSPRVSPLTWAGCVLQAAPLPERGQGLGFGPSSCCWLRGQVGGHVLRACGGSLSSSVWRKRGG